MCVCGGGGGGGDRQTDKQREEMIGKESEIKRDREKGRKRERK